MTLILQWLREELKLQPITLLVLIACGFGLYYVGFIDHVSKSNITDLSNQFNSQITAIKGEIADLKSGISDMKSTLMFNHAETEAHKSSEQIFAIKERMRDDAKNHRDTDRFLTERLNELEVLHEDQMREVNRLEAAGANR